MAVGGVWSELVPRARSLIGRRIQGNSQKLDATDRIGAEFAERFRSGGNEFHVIENREFVSTSRENPARHIALQAAATEPTLLSPTDRER